MIAIVDYDAGNIKSVEKAFLSLGAQVCLTRDPEVITSADKVVLPGVGNFGDAMNKLNTYGLTEPLKEVTKKGTPFLGICLGMQLIFEESEESPGIKGLCLCPGKIVRIPDGLGLKVPHIGWNSLDYPSEGRLFSGIKEGSYVYFVHSYYLPAENSSVVKASCEYGVRVGASVELGNVFGCQFHPEKSSDVGLHILKNFVEL
jgi:glutamine amidotransferase